MRLVFVIRFVDYMYLQKVDFRDLLASFLIKSTTASTLAVQRANARDGARAKHDPTGHVMYICAMKNNASNILINRQCNATWSC